MLVFVIVLELSKLIRIMPLLINSEEEPTGKLFFFSKNLVKLLVVELLVFVTTPRAIEINPDNVAAHKYRGRAHR